MAVSNVDYMALYLRFLKEEKFKPLDPLTFLSSAVIEELIASGISEIIEKMSTKEDRRKAFFLDHMPLRLAEGLKTLTKILEEKKYGEAAKWLKDETEEKNAHLAKVEHLVKETERELVPLIRAECSVKKNKEEDVPLTTAGYSILEPKKENVPLATATNSLKEEGDVPLRAEHSVKESEKENASLVRATNSLEENKEEYVPLTRAEHSFKETKQHDIPLLRTEHSVDNPNQESNRTSCHNSLESTVVCRRWEELLNKSRQKHPRRWSRRGLLVYSVFAVIAILAVIVAQKGQGMDSNRKSTIDPTTNSSFSTAEKIVTDEKFSTVSTAPISVFLSNLVKPRSNRSSDRGTTTPIEVWRGSTANLQNSREAIYFPSKITDAAMERNFPYSDERLAEDPTCVTVQGGNKWQYFRGSTKIAKVDRRGDVRIRRNETFDSFFRVSFSEYPYINKTLSAVVVLKRRSSPSEETLGYCSWTISEREISERRLQHNDRAKFGCTFRIRKNYRRIDKLRIKTYEASTICASGTDVRLIPTRHSVKEN